MSGRTIIILIVLVTLGIGFFYTISSSQDVLTTPEGIPRKLVVRKDKTPLYHSELLKTSSKTDNFLKMFYLFTDILMRKYNASYDSQSLYKSSYEASQWSILYAFGDVGAYYLVSADIEYLSNNPFFIRKTDVIEWNSFFCLTYKNSPHKVDRKPIRTYKTLEGARTGRGLGVMIEKEKHKTFFLASDAELILQEYNDSIYYVTSLYDDIDEDGDYVFLGNYDMGYVKYAENAHEFRRYINKKQLDKQIRYVIGVRSLAKRNMNPTELDKLYGPLSDLLADFGKDVKESVQDIMSVFGSVDVPAELQEDGSIFDPDLIRGRDTWKIDPQLNEVANTMNDYLKNDWIWNNDGYAYVPAEWMDE